MAQIFLSYSRRDRVFTGKLVSDLEYNGYTVWIDRQGLEGGISFPKGIENAIRNAQAVVLVASPDSLQASYIQKEISYAIGLGKPVIPVHCREVGRNRGIALTNLHWIEEFKNPNTYAEGLQHLANTLDKFGVYRQESKSSALEPPVRLQNTKNGENTQPTSTIRRLFKRNDYVFLSYARPDEAVADRVELFLKKYHIRYFRDVTHIAAGANWDTEIEKALRKTTRMILLLSSTSMPYRKEVYREWFYFDQKEKPLHPILIEECDIHSRLLATNYVDGRVNLTNALQNLLSHIKR